MVRGVKGLEARGKAEAVNQSPVGLRRSEADETNGRLAKSHSGIAIASRENVTPLLVTLNPPLRHEGSVTILAATVSKVYVDKVF